MESEYETNKVGARMLNYLRGSIEFERKHKERSHSIVFVGSRVKIIKQIVEALLEDSRMTLTEISKRTGIPIATVFDNLSRIKDQFHFTIVPKSLCVDERIAVFEAGQTRMYDFKPFLKAS